MRGVKGAPVARDLNVGALQETPQKKLAKTKKTGEKRTGEGEENTFVGERITTRGQKRNRG